MRRESTSGERLPSRRERVVGDSPRLRPVGVHHVEVGDRVAVMWEAESLRKAGNADEGDLLAVR